jgi:hypothetical protein
VLCKEGKIDECLLAGNLVEGRGDRIVVEAEAVASCIPVDRKLQPQVEDSGEE